MTYDIDAVRARFPALRTGVAHFDGPGGTQTPDVVAAAVADTLLSPIANRGRTTAAERTADDIVIAARQAMADLLGAEPDGIVFGRSMTQLTYDLSRAVAKTWRPGDEVVVSRLDHDANVRPWIQAAEAAGAVVRWVEFDRETTELTVAHVEQALSARTRLVAVTAASNLIGTRPPIAAMAPLAHAAGALLYVDGVHATAHGPVDVAALGCDFYACSPYKFCGPHLGVVAARPEVLEPLAPDKLLPSTNQIPERFELGTLPYELLAGTTAAVEFLAGLAPAPPASRRAGVVAGMTAVERYEDELRYRLEAGLAAVPGIVSYSRATDRTPTLLLTIDGRDPADAYRFLAERRINAPASSFYALEPSRWLGLGDTGGLRVGLAPYSNADDVTRLVDGLAAFTAGC